MHRVRIVQSVNQVNTGHFFMKYLHTVKPSTAFKSYVIASSGKRLVLQGGDCKVIFDVIQSGRFATSCLVIC